jgi:hypothetical protein
MFYLRKTRLKNFFAIALFFSFLSPTFHNLSAEEGNSHSEEDDDDDDTRSRIEFLRKLLLVKKKILEEIAKSEEDEASGSGTYSNFSKDDDSDKTNGEDSDNKDKGLVVKQKFVDGKPVLTIKNRGNTKRLTKEDIEKVNWNFGRDDDEDDDSKDKENVEEERDNDFEVKTPTELGDKALSLIGVVETAVDSVPPVFTVLFNGYRSRTTEFGFFSFHTDSNEMEDFELVITGKVGHKFGPTGIVDSIFVPKGKKYRKIRCRKIVEDDYRSWKIENDLSGVGELALDERTIVLVIPPKYVGEIREWGTNLPNELIPIPKIVISSKIPKRKLRRRSRKSILLSSDLNPHYRVLKRKMEVSNKHKSLSVLDS